MAIKNHLTKAGEIYTVETSLAKLPSPARPPRFSRLTRPGLFLSGVVKSAPIPSAPGPSRLGLALNRRQEAASGAGL